MVTGDLIPELGRKELRGFGLTTGAIVVALFGLGLPWLLDSDWPVWPWAVAAPLIALAVAQPLWLRGVYRVWMRFGALASRITTPIILGIVYFLLIWPLAAVRRAAGRDAMARRFLPERTSYRLVSEKAPKSRMERPY